jgi:hypothetical protein
MMPVVQVQSLKISRFKSVRELSIPCRKVNLFIGAPDTGKTNILEALQLFGCLGWNLPIGTSIRLGSNPGFAPLFYQQFFDQPVTIAADDITVTATLEGESLHLNCRNPRGGGDGRITFPGQLSIPAFSEFRHYSYTSTHRWTYETGGDSRATSSVIPPDGRNFFYLARHHQRVYDFLKETIADLDWKLRFDNAQKTFYLSEVRKDDIFDYNLDLLSDSLKRLIFYGAILLTSETVVLVMDEPDVYAFPPYPKILGEMIAADSSNQFFLTTHNPYFLAALVEKTPASDLALFVCGREPENGTTARLLGPSEVEAVIEQGASVFFNLEEFLGV